ncbi:hypothetical protein L211DRAFT_845747 [Terfezia boudieri ATCC MYA-4762]|uniref:Uncharacterized protein n=1 Tax=Terfezia boudieri ATCC MYA-4762 TaxID=1051890 RepID=A0A3N4M4A1_9PEZI|nr:hypothetical protein L211DRAFT_845747 [Terfezia boudieri ATCC MYA-4762]
MVSRLAVRGNVTLTTLAGYMGICCTYIDEEQLQIVIQVLEDFAKIDINNSQAEVQLEQLETLYEQATSSPIAGHVWPSLLANTAYSRLAPEKRVLKLHHAMRNISLLKLLIEQHEAARSYNPQTTLASPDIDPALSSNLDPDNYESTHPYILPPVEESGPSSGAPLEFQPSSTGGFSPLGMQPHSYLAMDTQFLQLPLGATAPYSALPLPQRDTLDTHIRNEQRMRQNGEDQEPNENPHCIVSAPSMGFCCPLLSCGRNQCTPPKLFGRTDNLRTHLKAVHGLPITDGVRLPKWLAENPGALEDAEYRAQASLLLRY